MKSITVSAPLMAALFCALGCSGKKSFSTKDCFSLTDCPGGDVCFFGKCVPPGYAISTVHAELSPPNDTPWLGQQMGPIHLPGFQHITLVEAVEFKGSVVVEGSETSKLSGTLEAISSDSIIPNRSIVRSTEVNASGFVLHVTPGIYSMTFVPKVSVQMPEAGLSGLRPPHHYPELFVERDRTQNLPYPNDNDLVVVTGRMLYKPGSPVANADVFGQAENFNWPTLSLRSTHGYTNAQGDFLLVFPPMSENLSVTVRPATFDQGNTFVPETTFSKLTTLDSPGSVGDLVLGVDMPGVAVHATITDGSGNAVENANVRFEGNSLGTAGGKYVAVGSTDAAGSVESMVFAGDYRVVVAPPLSKPQALTVTSKTIPNGEFVDVQVRSKVRLSGRVLTHAGRAVSRATVTARLRKGSIPRTFETTTMSGGYYDLDVDPGFSYEIVVQPDLGSGLPRYRKLIQVDDASVQEQDFSLCERELVYGRVYAPNGNPAANVVVAFYSLELGDNQDPMLVGVVQTLDGSRAGEFVLPVPVPPCTQ